MNHEHLLQRLEALPGRPLAVGGCQPRGRRPHRTERGRYPSYGIRYASNHWVGCWGLCGSLAGGWGQLSGFTKCHSDTPSLLVHFKSTPPPRLARPRPASSVDICISPLIVIDKSCESKTITFEHEWGENPGTTQLLLAKSTKIRILTNECEMLCNTSTTKGIQKNWRGCKKNSRKK